MKLIWDFFQERKAFVGLWLLNVLISTAIFLIASRTEFNDAKGYWYMGESLLHGKFSSWYFLSKYYPETLRTPGYPMFLAFCQLISSSELFVKVFQLLIYFWTVYICLRIIHSFDTRLLFKNVFLLILLPNVQVVYYTGFIATEILATFLLILVIYLLTKDLKKLNAFFSGILLFLLFIVKPAFLLLPFLIVAFLIVQSRKNLRSTILMTSIYLLLLIPFGLWNLSNHGKFKITSIEGGAGVAHMGYWQLKLPDGFSENYYWGNNTGFDLTKPQLYGETELRNNAKAFNSEWRFVLDSIEPYNSEEDQYFLEVMEQEEPGMFKLYNSSFTIEREKLLWDLTIKNIKKDLPYYIISRVYHVLRFYFTGVNYKNLQNSNSLVGVVKNLYPFAITFCFILVGLLLLTFVGFRQRKNYPANYYLMMVTSWYIGIIHAPFVIQARYTIPVHLLILILVSKLLADLILKKNR